jgi:hypothetical protein
MEKQTIKKDQMPQGTWTSYVREFTDEKGFGYIYESKEYIGKFTEEELKKNAKI